MEHETGPDGHGESDASAAAAAGPTASAPEAGLTASAPEAGLTASAPEAGRAIPADPAPSTGEPRVDAALRLLDRLDGLPVSEHPDLFEQVHAQLSDVLGELDSGPAGA
ncbi:MAG TPA: hypothetical protein VK836_17100 [Streptosporangiaceae bacterium]|nr:hypothetical protein [Streptosporangiaceae bacterium]